MNHICTIGDWHCGIHDGKRVAVRYRGKSYEIDVQIEWGDKTEGGDPLPEDEHFMLVNSEGGATSVWFPKAVVNWLSGSSAPYAWEVSSPEPLDDDLVGKLSSSIKRHNKSTKSGIVERGLSDLHVVYFSDKKDAEALAQFSGGQIRSVARGVYEPSFRRSKTHHEICMGCGDHIRNHYGGSDNRCIGREDWAR